MASLAIPLITAGLSGIAGLFGARPQKTTASGTQDTTQNTVFNHTPEQQQMINQILAQYNDQITNGIGLDGYKSQGIQDINKTSDANQTAIQNMLAQRGLSFSPAASTSLVQNRVAQGGQTSTFLNSLPLLQYQLKSQALTGAGNFVNNQKVNSTTTGHTSSQATQTGSGNMLGGLFAGIGSGIASTLGARFANQGKK